MDFVDFYRDKSILLTGATGFMGKVLLEKILRSLSNFKAIYVMVRAKKTMTIQERLEQEILSSEIFETVFR